MSASGDNGVQRLRNADVLEIPYNKSQMWKSGNGAYIYKMISILRSEILFASVVVVVIRLIIYREKNTMRFGLLSAQRRLPNIVWGLVFIQFLSTFLPKP